MTVNDDNDNSKYIMQREETVERLNVMYKLTVNSTGDSYYGDTMDELIANYSRSPKSLAQITVEKCIYLKLNEPVFLARLSECIAEYNAKRDNQRMAAWELDVAELVACNHSHHPSLRRRYSGLVPRIAAIVCSYSRADTIGLFLLSGTLCNLTDHTRWIVITYPFQDESCQFARLSGFVAIADMLAQ